MPLIDVSANQLAQSLKTFLLAVQSFCASSVNTTTSGSASCMAN